MRLLVNNAAKVREIIREMKSLIAYYSRAGENYASGSIVNLPVGNTELTPFATT